MKLEITKQECIWLAKLVDKNVTEIVRANHETPHPLLELQIDNMSALEQKLNVAIRKQVQKKARDTR